MSHREPPHRPPLLTTVEGAAAKRRIFGGPAMVVGFVLLLVVAAGRAVRWRLARTHPALVGSWMWGGPRLHIHRSGTGPTVVFDAGRRRDER